MSDLPVRLREQLASDHIRGCMGRQYHCDCGYDTKTEGLLQTAADRIEALEAAQEKAFGYATRLLEIFVEEHFPHNPDWKPQSDLIGVLMQIDNAVTITRDYKEKLLAYEGSPARAALAPEQDK